LDTPQGGDSVSELTLAFWIIKIMPTIVGETVTGGKAVNNVDRRFAGYDARRRPTTMPGLTRLAQRFTRGPRAAATGATA
jgi:hypothetical protein